MLSKNGNDLTKFEWKVLQVVMNIPIGQTRTYQEIAKAVGRPNAARAVGQALRKNPYPLIIPCHRVIKSDGTTGGYCGVEGSKKKERLIALEKKIARAVRK